MRMILRKLLLALLLTGALNLVYGQDFYQGVDLSYVNELEDCGAAYADRTGTTGDPYEILAEEGANIVRIRLWHNPEWIGYQGFEDAKKSILRAKDAEMQVLLDFHYSDFWADPGRQWRPAAWEAVTSNEVLGDSVYNYTLRVLNELKTLNLVPEMVQIGNEINANMMQVRGDRAIDSNSPNNSPVDWPRQVGLLHRGIQAVSDFNDQNSADVQTVIHVADPTKAVGWFNSAIANGLEGFDIIGLSYYAQWHNLDVREVGEYIATFKSSYNKEVMIVETAYPWTLDSSSDNANNVLGLDGRLFTYGGTLSIENQRDFLIELNWIVRENGGLGIIYWEPAWISSSCQTYWETGSHWENAALFDLEGRLHAGADFLAYNYDQQPTGLEDQEVTFMVDMTAIDTSNGVFVTGDFTGNSWQFQEMTSIGDGIFEFVAQIPGRTSGAYVYYKDDGLSTENRESVPSACRKPSSANREYLIQGTPATYYFSWGRCDQEPNEFVLSNKPQTKSMHVYPTVVADRLYVDGLDGTFSMQAVDLSGRQIALDVNPKGEVMVSGLQSGVHMLHIQTVSGIYSTKIIKR